MKKVNILNLKFDNLSKLELLENIVSGGIVFTPNVDHLIKLQKDKDFYEAYQSATYKVCDSQIVMYVSKFLGTPLKEKISGSDLFPAFYYYYRDDERIKIFLLGAGPGVAQQAQEKINHKLGRTMIVGVYSPSFGFEKNPKECQEIVNMINKSGANVLAIGVGAPKQEKWIFNHKDQLHNIKIFLAVGATLDFEADYKKRSPQWMSTIGIEWLHRLFSEPGRLWKRYLLEDIEFFWLIIKQKFNFYTPPFDLESYNFHRSK